MIEIPIEELIEALNLRGTVAGAAALIGVSRQAVSKRIKKYEIVKDVVWKLPEKYRNNG